MGSWKKLGTLLIIFEVQGHYIQSIARTALDHVLDYELRKRAMELIPLFEGRRR